MAKISVEHLKYMYPMTDKLVLNDISFQVEAGEIVGIVGTNGAGKSTLCQALVGLVPNFYKGRYGGHVFIDGMEVTKAESSDLVSKIGIVFQSPFTQVTGSKLTVFEEIAFGPENIGLPREEILKRVEYGAFGYCKLQEPESVPAFRRADAKDGNRQHHCHASEGHCL